jgi:hypothetical protein
VTQVVAVPTLRRCRVVAGSFLRVRKPRKAPVEVEAGDGKGEPMGEFMDHFGDRYRLPSPHTVLCRRSSAPGSPGQPGRFRPLAGEGLKPLNPFSRSGPS